MYFGKHITKSYFVLHFLSDSSSFGILCNIGVAPTILNESNRLEIRIYQFSCINHLCFFTASANYGEKIKPNELPQKIKSRKREYLSGKICVVSKNYLRCGTVYT